MLPAAADKERREADWELANSAFLFSLQVHFKPC
jgi:hypothetical protein